MSSTTVSPKRCRALLADAFRWALVALLLVLSGRAVEAGEVMQVDLEGVRIIGSYSGPGKLTGGYFQLQFELHNRSEVEAAVSIEIEQQWGEEDRVTRDVRLAPGERALFAPVLRARVSNTNFHSITLSVNGERNALGLGPRDWSSGNEHCWMYYAPATVEAGSDERWATAWNAASSHREFAFGAGTYEELPTQWQAYSCYDVVVLRVEDRLPPAEALDALFAWVRAGGCLVLSGRDPRAWVEARSEGRFLGAAFEATGKGESEVGGHGHVHEGAPVSGSLVRGGQHIGQGLLFFLEIDGAVGAEMEAPAGSTPAAMELLEGFELQPWVSKRWGTIGRLAEVKSGLGGFGNLPLRGLMMLLVAFALVIGPVNFLWVKRMKRPLLLLATVPAVALVGSVALILFGILSQGLDVKSTSSSYTFLDQVSRQATTAEVRRVFAGSSPGSGLRPEPGTAVFPIPPPGRAGRRQRSAYFQDLNEGRVLGGDYLPIRRPFLQALVTDQPTRLRLEVEPGGEGVLVSNALGGAVESLLLRGVSGDYYELSAPLGAGERVELAEVKRLATLDEWRPILARFWGEAASWKQELPPGTYLAKADVRELRDRCGIVVNEIESEQYLMGVFAAGGGEGR